MRQASDPAVPSHVWLALALALVAGQALILHWLGQPPICTCGVVRLWQGEVLGPENSQQITDWYTFSHVIHGFAFYLLLWLVAPPLPVLARLAIAVGLEAAWEVIENTPFVIERYREQALAQGYVGDSILNSVSDTVAAIIGFALARILPVWPLIGLTLAMELLALLVIRDNLALNILQLVWPSDTIARWQLGG